ncbi:TPA: hypothetical protein QDB06_000748 [Burkholderia vietnamiensis]|nr:hypothetical protein [Burkholderia vietnamiensis]
MEITNLEDKISFEYEKIIYTDSDDERHEIGRMEVTAEWFIDNEKVLEKVVDRFIAEAIYDGTTIAELDDLGKTALSRKLEEFEIESDGDNLSPVSFCIREGIYGTFTVAELDTDLPEELAELDKEELEEHLRDLYWETDDYAETEKQLYEYAYEDLAEEVKQKIRNYQEHYPIAIPSIDFSKITDTSVIEEMAGACHSWDYSQRLMKGVSTDTLIKSIELLNEDSVQEYVENNNITNKELASSILEIYGSFLAHMPDEIREDRELVNIAMASDGRALRSAAKFCDEIEMVKLAITSAYEDEYNTTSPIYNIRYASERLLDNEELVSFAFEQHEGWKALRYLSDRYKNDKEIAKWAVSQDPAMLEHVAEILKDDPEVVLLALNADSNETYNARYVREYIGKDLKEMIDIDWHGEVTKEDLQKPLESIILSRKLEEALKTKDPMELRDSGSQLTNGASKTKSNKMKV